MPFGNRFRREQMPAVTAHAVTLLGAAPGTGPRILSVSLGKTSKSSRSGPGVETVVDRAQPCFENMCVDLSGRQIGMAEHHLNRAQVGAAVEQVGRKRVPQDMRA